MNNQINENSHLFKIPPKYLNPHLIVKHSLNIFWLFGGHFISINIPPKKEATRVFPY
jgi:hypothetical protein